MSKGANQQTTQNASNTMAVGILVIFILVVGTLACSGAQTIAALAGG